MRLLALVALLLAFLPASSAWAQRDPILVPEVSQHEVRVRQGFTGTELLLFGAILDPAGTRSARGYDVVVVLKGPSQPIRLREKDKVGGVWINASSTDFRSAPSYFAVASSKPIEEIVDEKTAAIYEFGTQFIQLSPTGVIDPEEQARFSAGLVDLKRRQGLYKENMRGVTISEGVLYQARISLPSNVTTGTYTAETFAVTGGRVVSSAIAEVQVRKVGFERLVEIFAQENSFIYGLLAVALSVSMGWIAGRLFALI
ncbi:Putative transmembrane protein (Alph_Pro_TM) [Tsuneonella dongtanensis]|uniref:Putative transmembrane protein (Alph_Pro_TM) n=1 Tax=Tsuneonella dongtanensis TaxID=692370 RepID=A0A1B2ACU8_9SPHN|nr:TIGR02186 family protein [Tsuneonella dongtanensis]ANY19921.1 Putative transmembrane protein (Alph_Pro_TM) [Tsuneonella dongtanensis]